jgi:hypothetical protein
MVGCAGAPEVSDVDKYLMLRGDSIDPKTVQTIRAGKIVPGMYPDEARAAGGPFIYSVKPDPEDDRPFSPLRIIYGQRGKPDNAKIELTFRNCTQFDTEEPTAFTVFFERGKAVRIERRDEKKETK